MKSKNYRQKKYMDYKTTDKQFNTNKYMNNLSNRVTPAYVNNMM